MVPQALFFRLFLTERVTYQELPQNNAKCSKTASSTKWGASRPIFAGLFCCMLRYGWRNNYCNTRWKYLPKIAKICKNGLINKMARFARHFCRPFLVRIFSSNLDNRTTGRAISQPTVGKTLTKLRMLTYCGSVVRVAGIWSVQA